MAKKRTIDNQNKSQRRATNISSNKKNKVEWKFPLQRRNFIIAGVGLVVILIAYGLMWTGVTEQPALPNGKWNNPFAVTVAPIMLIIGYCVIIPYAIFSGGSGKKETEVENTES